MCRPARGYAGRRVTATGTLLPSANDLSRGLPRMLFPAGMPHATIVCWGVPYPKLVKIMNVQAKPRGSSHIWLIPLLSIVAGSTVGGLSAGLNYQEPQLRLAGHVATASDPPAPLEDAKPRVYLPAPNHYDFGVMARNERQSHTFKVRNIGGGPLTLKVLDTTCKCTVGSLDNDTIQPGETGDVTLTWEAVSYDREFRQSATIETSDQSQREIILSVSGQVLQLAMPDLPLVKFSRVSRSDPQSFQTKVYGYRDKDLVITGFSFSDEETADFFTVKTEPLPKEDWADAQAQSAILVSVDIKPGLPLGIVRQIMALETNKEDIAPMDVAIDMTVVSDISVLGGREFNDETNLLRLGPVQKSDGKESKLHLMVKGQYKEQVQFSVAEMDPASALDVRISEPVDIKTTNDEGIESLAARRFPLAILVKKDSPSMQRMGSKQGALGRIVFNTEHPEIEQFEIKVQFAVQ